MRIILRGDSGTAMSAYRDTVTVPTIRTRSLSAYAWFVRARVRRPLLADTLVALCFLALWLVGIAVGLAVGWMPYDPNSYVMIGIIAAFALALCRRLPLTGLVIVGVLTSSPLWRFDSLELRVLPITLAAFIATSSGLRLRIALPTALGFAALTLLHFIDVLPAYPGFGIYLTGVPSGELSARILSIIVVVAAVALGASGRVQRLATHNLRLHNLELVRLREVDDARVVAEERTAIAREIHDVVAHHVSAMVIRAQAADRVADARPEELRSVVRWIALSGQEALTAMREIVHVLRADQPAALAPVFSFTESLNQVVARVQGTGLVVDSTIDPNFDFDFALTALQQAAVLRITQESLTNVLLHSAATSVQFRLLADEGTLRLTIEDGGGTRERGNGLASRDISRIGTGVRGMRERAESLGGSLDAGMVADIGWRVDARLPLALDRTVTT